MSVDFLASQPHYADHLRPVWDALPDEARGTFYGPGSRRAAALARTVVVASGADRNTASARRVILFQHGIGQSYGGAISREYGYPGNSHQRGVIGFPSPNRHAAARWIEAYPELPAPIVGMPKMDYWHLRPPKPVGNPPIVAVSFHWDCHVAPETRSSFEEYADAVRELARQPIKLLGHAHPRSPELIDWFEEHGIETVRDFREVLERADVYICDNSSTLYEFASTDRPVVVVNGSQYRRDVSHGLRFWDLADVGVNCDEPASLIARTMSALDEPIAVTVRRLEIVADLFPHRGRAAEVAAAAVLELEA